MEVIAEKDIEVVIDNVGEVSTNSALEVDVIDNNELAVSVNRKEFTIVGDELYIPKRYEDAPQWLRDLISTVTEQSYAQKITDLNNLSTSLQQLIVELEVAKNTYTQSIISSSDIDERINTAITTLNSSLAGSDATIVDLISTKATPDEASAIALNTISSSINNGEIGALVGSVSNTLTTETEALANNIDLVHAEMLGGFESTADVIQTTQAYVGIDEAGASTGTGLSAYLEDSLGNIGGADSQVANGVYINNGVPTSKFEYTSDLSKNGVHYKSGFGLKTLATGGDGSAANPYDSEFWINAAKLKFTNDNVTGQVAPFAIDATGVTPQITFNGKVSFTNVTNVPQLGSTPQEVVTAINNAQTTTINGPAITTGSITAAQIQANSISADRLMAGTSGSTVWSGGGLISANFNGNPYGSIGSPTQGFRLSANAAGTSTDPNIYGAYIKGGTVEGTAFLYPTNTVGNFAPYYYNEYKYLNFTVGASTSGTVYTPAIQLVSPSYSSGLLLNRVKNLNTSVITIDTTGAISQLFADNYINTEIQISRDGGSYTKLDSMTTAEGVNKMYVGTITGYSNYINLRLQISYGNSGTTAYETAAALKVHLDNTII